MNINYQKKKRETNVGVFGIGYDVYWKQFDGLKDDIDRKFQTFKKLIPDFVNVIDFGIVDNPEKAYESVKSMQQENLDFLFCDMLTYGTSGTFGTIIRNVHVPIVLAALQPMTALNYEKASTYAQLMNDDICALPEFTGVAMRFGRPAPEIIIGTLYDDAQSQYEIEEYCRMAVVLHDLKYAKLGHIGHPLNSMLDMNTDPTMISAFFGSHTIECEPEELVDCFEKVNNADIKQRSEEILRFFDTPDPVSDPISLKLRDKDLYLAAKVSLALDAFVQSNQLDGLSYYYEGEPGTKAYEVMSNLIVGNSLLSSRHVPMCGESDQKTLIALMIMDRLGIGGSFAEFHPIDFNEAFVLVGHDGPHNISIADGKPVLRSLRKYHGKPGCGAGVEFKIKEGPITILSINSTPQGRFKFVIAEGESMRGPIPPTGNTNTRGFFGTDIKKFIKSWVKEGPTHHFALGTGHKAKEIAKIAEFLGLDSVIVTDLGR